MSFERFFVRELHQQYVQKQQLLARIEQFFDQLMADEHLTLAQLCSLLLQSALPIISQLKIEHEGQIRNAIQNEVKKFSVEEVELSLLAKDECWLSDKR